MISNEVYRFSDCLDLYEKNDSIPDEIEDLIDDYTDFFRGKSLNPVNEVMMTFPEDDCIWVGTKS